MVRPRRALTFPGGQKQNTFLFGNVLFLASFCFFQIAVSAQRVNPVMRFAVDMKNPASQRYAVTLNCQG